uniref:Uncharacterized protein n=1 Tax=Timema douglasi TaxID=61478 RepID=A0A7R8VCB3_TIMDO|nr:unnamed protein product [Timema douglasi]
MRYGKQLRENYRAFKNKKVETMSPKEYNSYTVPHGYVGMRSCVARIANHRRTQDIVSSEVFAISASLTLLSHYTSTAPTLDITAPALGPLSARRPSLATRSHGRYRSSLTAGGRKLCSGSPSQGQLASVCVSAVFDGAGSSSLLLGCPRAELALIGRN